MEAAPGTYGALLLGALFAAGFSGIAGVQLIMYFKLFPDDRLFLKFLVLFVWFLDCLHTGLVWSSLWLYLITHFASPAFADYIPETIALSVVLTAALTFIAHCLFAHRIFRLSGGEMIHLKSYTHFREKFQWLFSLGLGLSSGVDVLITLCLLFLLRRGKSNSLRLGHIIDSIVLYTLEIGGLTSAATVVSLICWIQLSNSLVFLGLHFVIGKPTLNTREVFRRAHTAATLELMQNRSRLHSGRRGMGHSSTIRFCNSDLVNAPEVHALEVNVSKSVSYD
ncbi:hypothetical protein CVT24_007187 [Panaeolus cyanescens]|uniref:DUF6534 domain-containing protein n=1 Tax=Panaeolus cyanescens TaxID=181874 RepID=A0A409VJC7_9AGAR|nr:hypothetical protein CVT24_007187 [Panaeolus cyanescens]